MTAKSLMNYFENYYGEKYTGVFFETVFNYLDGYSSEFYSACAKVIIKKFSRTHGKVPDVAIFEKNSEEIWLEVEKSKVYLPEPPVEKATPEEAEAFINQMRSLVKTKKPMSSSLTKMMDKMAV